MEVVDSVQLFEDTMSSNIGLVDFRSISDFGEKHLFGSTNLPWENFADRAHELPPKYTPINILAYQEDVKAISDHLTQKNYPLQNILINEEDLWKIAKERRLIESGNISKILWIPSPCLLGVIDMIETLRVEDGLPRCGVAVDLACGSARDGVFLSTRGWTTHNFDYSSTQIKKASELSLTYSVDHLSNFHVLDVADKIDMLVESYTVDLVNVSRYLNRDLFPSIKKLVIPGGFIVFHTFMSGCKKPRKAQFKLEDGELRNVFSEEFDVLEDKVYTILDGRPTSWFCARKKKI